MSIVLFLSISAFFFIIFFWRYYLYVKKDCLGVSENEKQNPLTIRAKVLFSAVALLFSIYTIVIIWHILKFLGIIYNGFFY